MKKQSVTDRINLLIKAKFKSKAQFSRAIGVPDSTLRQWVDHGAEPPADAITQICLATGVSPHWLILGIGSMFFEVDPDALSAKIKNVRACLDALEKELAEIKRLTGR